MAKKKFEQMSPTSALDADLLAGAASVGAPPPVASVTAAPTRTPAPKAPTENVAEIPRPARTPASLPDKAQRRQGRASDGPTVRVRLSTVEDQTLRLGKHSTCFEFGQMALDLLDFSLRIVSHHHYLNSLSASISLRPIQITQT